MGKKHAWECEKELAEASALGQYMLSRGFVAGHQGGNILAWQKNSPKGTCLALVNLGEHEDPCGDLGLDVEDFMGARWVASIHSMDGGWWTEDVPVFEGLAAALDWCDVSLGMHVVICE